MHRGGRYHFIVGSSGTQSGICIDRRIQRIQGEFLGRFPRTPPTYAAGVPFRTERYEEAYAPWAQVYIAEGTDMVAAVNDLSERLSNFRNKLVGGLPSDYGFRES